MNVETKIAVLFLVGFVIGLAVFIGTLLSIWKNRASANSQRAAKTSVIITLMVGLLGLLHWTMFGNEPVFPFAIVAIPLFYMAPTFVISFYVGLILLGKSDARQDQN